MDWGTFPWTWTTLGSLLQEFWPLTLSRSVHWVTQAPTSSSTAIGLRKYRIPSDLRSQAEYRPVSTTVGDHVGILGAVVFFFFGWGAPTQWIIGEDWGMSQGLGGLAEERGQYLGGPSSYQQAASNGLGEPESKTRFGDWCS